MCTVLLPPGDKPIAVNKYINTTALKAAHFVYLHVLPYNSCWSHAMLLSTKVSIKEDQITT
jgi:hypothetical protein